ncbi:uncharacterized protein BT62DRAFT_79409 [Guyanagaster necrorhizus]|uniref:Uncharacterized protein n=1 Tax=Guyanagaster necrorhizus TaxID=856835 RepID=A0A9P7VV11_9AGAR|nr:uncharacterized protein BT62DRAFT_79409 [Guyanagaster necrorhizus MCA 3950]KAG7447377.1 hypothetical protein BT62DRAFT_79409 [Guyanagaster necrorhizus MCA 3950]
MAITTHRTNPSLLCRDSRQGTELGTALRLCTAQGTCTVRVWMHHDRSRLQVGSWKCLMYAGQECYRPTLSGRTTVLTTGTPENRRKAWVGRNKSKVCGFVPGEWIQVELLEFLLFYGPIMFMPTTKEWNGMTTARPQRGQSLRDPRFDQITRLHKRRPVPCSPLRSLPPPSILFIV